MPLLEGARLADPIGHTNAMAGLFDGLLAGLAIGVGVLFVVGTGGVGAVFVGAGIAAGAAGGALAGMSIGEAIPTPPTGAIGTGSVTVLYDKRPAVRAGIDTSACSLSGTVALVAQGSATVFVNGVMAARRTSKLVCAATVSSGASSVLIGGDTANVPGLDIEDEVPSWLTTGLNVVAWGGGIVAAIGAIPVIGLGAAIGGFVGGLAGGEALGWAGGKIGDAIGGELGARIGGVVGGFLGGIGGGMIGAGIGGMFRPTPPKPGAAVHEPTASTPEPAVTPDAPHAQPPPDAAPPTATEPDLAPPTATEPDLAPPTATEPDLAPPTDTSPDANPLEHTLDDAPTNPEGATPPDALPTTTIPDGTPAVTPPDPAATALGSNTIPDGTPAVAPPDPAASALSPDTIPDGLPAVTPPAAPPPPAPVTDRSLFGTAINDVIDQSPSLSGQIDDFLDAGGTFRLKTPAENGSFFDSAANQIVFDPADLVDPANAVGTIAHEVGHGVDTRRPGIHGATNDLLSEGAATVNAAKARAEILAAGGPEITVPGARASVYLQIYQQVVNNFMSENMAIRIIARMFAHNEYTSTSGGSLTYAQYFTNHYGSCPLP